MAVNHPHLRSLDVQSAFTVLDIAIAFVVVGVIIGTILVGEEFVHAASIRATLSQLQQYDSAVQSFRSKYSGLPGDLANQLSFGLINASDPVLKDTGLNPGDGNSVVGQMDKGGAPYQTAYEYSYFWYNLYMSGLLYGDKQCIHTINTTDSSIGLSQGTCFPLSRVSGTSSASGTYGAPGTMGAWTVRFYEYGHYFQLLSATGWGGSASADVICGGAGKNNMFCNSLTAYDARAIDAKIDDGLPMSGNIRAFDASLLNWQGDVKEATTTFNTPTTGIPGSSNCVDNASGIVEYNVTSKAPYRCALNIKASF